MRRSAQGSDCLAEVSHGEVVNNARIGVKLVAPVCGTKRPPAQKSVLGPIVCWNKIGSVRVDRLARPEGNSLS